MSILVSVDPDTVRPGVAIFRNGFLVDARAAPSVDDALAYVAGFLSAAGGPPARRLVIEMPQQYRGVGRVKDFLRLAAVVGRFEQAAFAAGAGFLAVAPHKWKGGTVPKAPMSRRIWRELRDFERQCVQGISVKQRDALGGEHGRGVASGAASEITDAIGIGLWALGRLGKHRI